MTTKTTLRVESIIDGVGVPNEIVVPASLKCLFNSPDVHDAMMQLCYNVASATSATFSCRTPFMTRNVVTSVARVETLEQ